MANDATREERNRRERLRRQARKLEKRLGCFVEIEWLTPPVWGGSPTYWVHPPDDVYPARRDPLEGQHTACDWEEVIELLRVYEKDLHFHHWGVGEDLTDKLFYVDTGGLLQAWLTEPGARVRGLVLADYLMDHGGDELGEELHQCLKNRP